MKTAPIPARNEEPPTMSREAFVDLLQPNLQAVRAFVRRQLRNADYCEDIVQKTLLLAFANRHQLRASSKFRSWLFTIAVNEIRMFLRGVRPFTQLADFTGLALCDEAPSPLARYEQTERKERLQAAIARLSERDRTAIRLLDLDECSLGEAADRMSLSTSALKSTQFRARRRLANSVAFLQRLAPYRPTSMEQQ